MDPANAFRDPRAQLKPAGLDLRGIGGYSGGGVSSNGRLLVKASTMPTGSSHTSLADGGGTACTLLSLSLSACTPSTLQPHAAT
jgi:hypothetical protein